MLPAEPMPARVLRPRHRHLVRAFAQALLAIPEEDTVLDELVDRFEAHLGAVSRALRPLLLLALDWIRWLPLVLLVAWRPFDELAVEQRCALLERIDRSRSPLLFLPLVAYKTLLSMMHFEGARELRALGYSVSERTRWKRVA